MNDARFFVRRWYAGKEIMTFVYSVRCNFSDSHREDDWNDWYSGPKLKQMLRKPMFLSGQRFKASGLNQRRQYLALWVVESPDAFRTEEYTSDWGFFEWAPYIIDWSRDLYGPLTTDVTAAFAIAPDERLYLAAFEGLKTDEGSRIQEQVSTKRPGVIWMRSAGLDQHSPILGLQRLAAGEAIPEPLNEPRMQETIFRQISEYARAKPVV
jgi:hypothetical protein